MKESMINNISNRMGKSDEKAASLRENHCGEQIALVTAVDPQRLLSVGARESPDTPLGISFVSSEQTPNSNSKKDA